MPSIIAETSTIKIIQSNIGIFNITQLAVYKHYTQVGIMLPNQPLCYEMG